MISIESRIISNAETCSTHLCESVRGACEDLVERRYGFWRGFFDGVVARYLDYGIVERGFARIRCPDCAAECLLASSCKGRGLCPSCGTRRAAEFAAFFSDEVAADVGHAQRVFTVPKLLRPNLVHRRAPRPPNTSSGTGSPASRSAPVCSTRTARVYSSPGTIPASACSPS
jgi:hypothetical protein